MSPAAPHRAPPSLRQSVLRRVLPALAAAWLISAVVAAGTAQLFAQRAYDRSLLDDAYLLATHVRQGADGAIELSLTRRELNTVLFDQAETVYFSIRDADGRLVAGHAGLDMAATEEGESQHFGNIAFQGHLLRAVTLRRDTPAPFDVTVAQTTTVRNAVARRLLTVSLLPQLALFVALAFWLRRTIGVATRPLSELEQAVENRGVNDLAPCEIGATTHDVAALADAINALLARLQASVQAQREFSGNVAHELRTPLAGIRALAEYGLAQSDPARWREQLQAIAASEARASALVDKLLALSVAVEAETRLTLAPVRLDELTRQAVLRFLPRADAAGVDLGAEGIDAPVWVQADPALVEGILNNLIDNALRYGRAPQGTSVVTVSLAHSGTEVLLTVQDNGPGVPGERQAQLVARGTRGETAQLLAQGAGLGLALVAQYARLLKAETQLGSGEGGRGWACTVHFPAATPA